MWSLIINMETYTCEPCYSTVETKRKESHEVLCPGKNRLNINCSFCGNNIINFQIYPGGSLPTLPHYLCGGFICKDCEYKAYSSFLIELNK